MNIKKLETLCNQGSAKYNEDAIGITKNTLWVLDGATGLNNKNLISSESDAKWYVDWWNQYLHNNIEQNRSLNQIIKQGVKEIKEEYTGKLKNKTITKLDKPSSSLCIIRLHNNEIEYLILGDCSLHIKRENTVSILKDSNLCKLDSEVYEEMERLPNRYELTHEEIKKSVMNTIVKNRLKKNTKEGYWILEFEEDAIDNAIQGTIKVNTNTSIMLTSDGYSCISDRYKLIKEEELIEEVNKYGVNKIYKNLRSFEEEENSVNKYPRFKIKDDSSCIYLDISI